MAEFAIPPTGLDVATSQEHPAQVWEHYRTRITQLYSEENRSLKEIMTVMRNEYGFTATQKQYKTKITHWRIDKKLKDSEIRFMAKTQLERALEEKETNFRVRGRDVDPEKISRGVKRKQISDEELLEMAAAPTPSDISYGTPSTINQLSPYAEQPAVQGRDQVLDPMPNQIPMQSSWSPSACQNSPLFLVSPGYQAATPVPAGWYGPSNPAAMGSLQTPPGILLSPEAVWNTGSDDGTQNRSHATEDTNHSETYELKYTRFVELVKETEGTEGIDYMKAMFEFNGLLFDLITYDQSKSEMVVENLTAYSPKCYVCRALADIGIETMTSKVESERVVLEAIAISEGRFGEEHGAALHFRVKLFFLYRDWSCRSSESKSILLEIALLVMRDESTKNIADLSSELLSLPNSKERIPCEWLQSAARKSFLATSSHQMPAPSLRREAVLRSPRNVWVIITATMDGAIYDNEGLLKLEPLLDLILRQGPESVDGSLFFWMATFFSAIHGLWGPVFNSRHLIINTAIRASLSGSITLIASLEQLRDNPYRLEQPPEIAMTGEGGSNSGVSDRPSTAKVHSRFDNISKFKGPVKNLKQLRLVLAEISLSELEKTHHSEVPPFLLSDGFIMLDVLLDAARFGNSNLIKQLGTHFGTTFIKGMFPLTEFLNLSGEVGEWQFDEAPLHLAVSAGHTLTVEALIDAGADPNGPDGWDETPIFLAANAGHDEIEAHDVWLEAMSNSNEILLLLCAVVLIGDLESYELLGPVSKILREHKWSTDGKSRKSGVPILRSILDPWSRRELCDLLPELDQSGRGLELVLNALAGVHIEQQARGILKSVLLGTETEFNKLLNPDKASNPSRPVLHTLVSTNATNALGVFLELGPNFEASDEQGNTALHIAAAGNYLGCARQLLRHGMDVGIENVNGETALQVAVRSGHLKIMEEIQTFSGVSMEDEGDVLMS